MISVSAAKTWQKCKRVETDREPWSSINSKRRRIFSGAAGPELGRRLYERVLATARALHPQVECGEFGADMQVHLVNDGPVTIPITLRA